MTPSVFLVKEQGFAGLLAGRLGFREVLAGAVDLGPCQGFSGRMGLGVERLALVSDPIGGAVNVERGRLNQRLGIRQPMTSTDDDGRRHQEAGFAPRPTGQRQQVIELGVGVGMRDALAGDVLAQRTL